MKCVSTVLTCLLGLTLAACQPGQDTASDEAPAQTAAPPPPPPAAAPAPAPAAPAAAPPPPPAAQASQVPQTTTQASLLSEPDWVVLFAGHDLSSFNEVGDAQWNLIDDYVEADGYLQSFLVTRGEYTDFHLQLEFWPGPGANSGIFIRNDNPAAINAEDGYEINIYDTNPNPDNRTGSIVNHVPPLTAVSTEEQWNTYEITAQGNRIVAQVNGTVTADTEIDEHPSGPIAFQNNGGLIRFRDIRIRPL